MADQELLARVKDQVISLFAEHAIPELYFHNLDHSRAVVKALKEIAEHAKLPKKELVLVEIAAWLQDIAYLEKTPENNPDPAQIARTFLEAEQVLPATILKITELISASDKIAPDASLTEQVLIDANHYYLAKDSYLLKNEMLRLETEFFSQTKICAEKWLRESIKLMENHRYFTDWCRRTLTEKKAKNLAKLKKAHFLLKDELLSEGALHDKKLQKLLHEEASGTEKSIDTMFRIAASNNQRQFTLGDNKAHILITVNSIIMSIVVSLLIRKLNENPFLTWPTFIILVTSSVSIVFSILATRPKIDGGTFTPANLEHKDIDLLYFGNFHRMTASEYIEGMSRIMADQDFIHRTIILDAYWHGQVLARKFSFLRRAYNVFLFGLIISISAFVIAFLFHHPVAVVHKSGADVLNIISSIKIKSYV